MTLGFLRLPNSQPWLGSLLLILVSLIIAGCGNSHEPFGKIKPLPAETAMIKPPWETFVKAGPGAADDIDLETLNGMAKIPNQTLPAYADLQTGSIIAPAAPNEAMAPKKVLTMADSGQLADAGHKAVTVGLSTDELRLADAPNRTIEPDPGAQAPGASAEKSAPEAEGKADNKTVIKAVSVLPVSGDTPSGNAELTVAMRETLTTAGWTVLDKVDKNALAITGEVHIDTPQAGKQKIALVWSVKSPDGTTIGSIKQANDVEAGSLDKGWGATAIAVTEAAATGIFELINKLR